MSSVRTGKLCDRPSTQHFSTSVTSIYFQQIFSQPLIAAFHLQLTDFENKSFRYAL
jgi:hypothetical protein